MSWRDYTTLDDKVLGGFGKLSKLPSLAAPKVKAFLSRPVGPRGQAYVQKSNALQQKAIGALANTPKFNFSESQALQSRPLLKIGAQVAEGTLNIPSKLMQNYGRTLQDINSGKIYTGTGARQFAARTGENVLDVISLGKGKAAVGAGQQFLKGVTPLKTLMQQGAKQGLKTGAKYGFGYGALTEAQKEQTSLKNMLGQGAQGAVSGALTGLALGGSLPALGALPKTIKNSLRQRITTESLPGRWVANGVTRLPNVSGRIPIPNPAPGTRHIGGPFQTGFDPVSQSPIYGIHTEKYLPPQTVERGRIAPTVGDLMGQVREAMPRPGMSIEDITLGARVRATDRRNVGTVVGVKDGEALVRFFNKKTKLGSTVKLPLSKLETTGNTSPRSSRTGRLQDSGSQGSRSVRQAMSGGEKTAPTGRLAIPPEIQKQGVSYPEASTKQGEITRLSPDVPGRPMSDMEKIVGRVGQLPDGSPIYEQPRLALPSGQPEARDIEKIIYGRDSYVPQTGKEASTVQNIVRKGQEALDEGISRMNNSSNMLVRGTARFLQGFANGLGKKQGIADQTAKYRGGIDFGREAANDAQQKVYSLIGDNEESLRKIHSNLDPELYGGKQEKLNPNESQALDYLRQISDWINDTNFKNGFISRETWNKGRGGKYIARAYEAYDYPPEVADFVKQGNAKMDLGMFKQREGLTDWKEEEAIRDPAYLVAKRLQQTIFNDTTSRMFSWLKTQKDSVSETAKPGYTQLSDHKSFGDLAGKYVRNDILEDIKGFFFTHKLADDAYRLLRAYGRNPLRRGLKATKTVYNPAVRLGNRIGNFVFAWLNGINPITFSKNKAWAKQALESKNPLVTRLQRDGLLGTDFTKGEIVDRAVGVAQKKVKNIFSKTHERIASSYGKMDDLSKISAVKTWLDRGFSYEEALNRARKGFQDYTTVGKFYDIGSNIPVFGNAFVKFQGDLQRILKNAILEHPVRAFSTLMAIKLLGDVSSAISGESPEDRKTRESRVGTPHIPLTDIPLSFQTPFGEVNVSRMLGIYANTPVGGDSAANDFSKMLPFQMPSMRTLGSDPLIGPLVSVATDTDFRGKSIADPNQNKYTGTTLTEGEQWMNRAKYLGRSYNLPFLNDLIDTNSAFQGEKDFYGREKTPGQSIAKLFGFKMEDFGHQQAQEARAKEEKYQQYQNEDIQKKINAINKQLLSGEIDQATAKKRIQSLQSKMSDVNVSSMEVILNAPKKDRYRYLERYTQNMSQGEKAKAYAEGLGYDIKKVNQNTIEGSLQANKVRGDLKQLYFDQNVPSEVKTELYKAAGTDKKTVELYILSGSTIPTAQKARFVRQKLQGAKKADIMTMLDMNVITNPVVDAMYTQGLVTEEQGIILKRLIKGWANRHKTPKARKGRKPKQVKLTFPKPKRSSYKPVTLKQLMK